MLEQHVAAVRDAVGMEIPLSMDHLGHLGVKSIIRLGKAYEKYSLSWMEDVIPWTYTDLLKQISDQSPTQWPSMVEEGAKTPIVNRGWINVPDRPGLGVTLNENVVRQHLEPGSGYFEPTPYGDHERSWDRLWS